MIFIELLTSTLITIKLNYSYYKSKKLHQINDAAFIIISCKY